MKKIWLPYPIYFLKPFAVGLVGLLILYVSEDLFTFGFALLCLGYSGWIIFMRLMWSIKNAAKSRLKRSNDKKGKTYSANFPE
ncbi:MAG: hypothetical protein ACR2PB_12835 [Desulfocapsaceae bacterium]